MSWLCVNTNTSCTKNVSDSNNQKAILYHLDAIVQILTWWPNEWVEQVSCVMITIRCEAIYIKRTPEEYPWKKSGETSRSYESLIVLKLSVIMLCSCGPHWMPRSKSRHMHKTVSRHDLSAFCIYKHKSGHTLAMFSITVVIETIMYMCTRI